MAVCPGSLSCLHLMMGAGVRSADSCGPILTIVPVVSVDRFVTVGLAVGIGPSRNRRRPVQDEPKPEIRFLAEAHATSL